MDGRSFSCEDVLRVLKVYQSHCLCCQMLDLIFFKSIYQSSPVVSKQIKEKGPSAYIRVAEVQLKFLE
jgi:hypothetical protein